MVAVNPWDIDKQSGTGYNQTGVGGNATPAAQAEYYNSINQANNAFQQFQAAAGIFGGESGNPQNGTLRGNIMDGSFYNSDIGQYARSLMNGTSGGTPMFGIGGGAGGGGGYGRYGGGGGGGMSYAQAKANAQNVGNQYAAMMQGSDYGPLIELMRRGRRQDMRALNKAGKRANRQMRREARGARKDVRQEYNALEDYLNNNFSNSFAGVRSEAGAAPMGDTSTALLSSQGAGTGAVDAAVAQSQAGAQREAAAFNDLARMLAASENSTQQARLSDSRDSRRYAMDNIREQLMSGRQSIRDQRFAGRQAIQSGFRQNMLGVRGQEIAAQQQAREALMQLALQYGITLPEQMGLGVQGGGQ